MQSTLYDVDRGSQAVVIVCSHCGGTELVLGEVKTTSSGVCTYSLACSCGATANIMETWSFKNANPERKFEGSVIGVI
jgi:hypothetical protein